MYLRIALVILFFLAIPAWHSSATLPSAPMAEQQKKEETVAFNVKSRKYHCLSCQHVKRCTVNCIRIARSDAKQRGGDPCKHCGGTCRR